MMMQSLPIIGTVILAVLYAVMGQYQTTDEISDPQYQEVLSNSKTIMDSVFLTIVDNFDAMDHLQLSLASSLNMTHQAIPTTGISNFNVSNSMINFKLIMAGLSDDLMSSCHKLKLRIEALRMGMQTGQETLDQAFIKMQHLAKCSLKQLSVIVNQIRNCTFRALTVCKSEVAVIQDGISDALLEVHKINMRMAHCSLMNPKNAVPCITVLTNEAPDIVESAQSDLPTNDDVEQTLDGINKCTEKILQNVATICA